MTTTTTEQKKPLTEQQKARRRVAVAKDVLKQIATKKYLSRRGMYVTATLPATDGIALGAPYDRYRAPDASLQLISKRATKCQVCALGGVFMSFARLYNEIKVNARDVTSMSNIHWERDDGTAAPPVPEGSTLVCPVGPDGNGSIYNTHLSDVFDIVQLGLIESAFEINSTYAYGALRRSRDGSYSDTFDEDVEFCNAAVDFGYRYKTDTGRLKGIMNNIVKNGGTFKP